MPRIAPLRRPEPSERTRWQRLPPRLREALVLALAVSAFLLVAVVFVEFLQPAVKRWVAGWISQLGGTRSNALVLGATIGAAAFGSTWLAANKWRHAAWSGRIALTTSSFLIVFLALGLAPQSRIADDAHRQTIEAAGGEQTAVLVDVATDAMMWSLIALAAVAYLIRRLRGALRTG